MKRAIPCPCGNVFPVESGEEVNLDQSPEDLEKILDGSFLNFTCSACGKLHKPEFPLIISWPSKKIRLEVLPELDRGAFYRRKKDPPGTETVIGYPEMSGRLAIIRDGLEPAAIETVKYYLLLKACEDYPDREVNVSYFGMNPDGIEFHLHGIKEGETAVTRIPRTVYEKTRADFKKRPKAEIFAALRTRSYLSVQNILRPDALK